MTTGVDPRGVNAEFRLQLTDQLQHKSDIVVATSGWVTLPLLVNAVRIDHDYARVSILSRQLRLLLHLSTTLTTTVECEQKRKRSVGAVGGRDVEQVSALRAVEGSKDQGIAGSGAIAFLQRSIEDLSASRARYSCLDVGQSGEGHCDSGERENRVQHLDDPELRNE